jgi:hypothetical protein
MATRLTDLAGRWLKDWHRRKSKECGGEGAVASDPTRRCSDWGKERKPKTMGDAAQLAEDYFQARPASTSLKTE